VPVFRNRLMCLSVLGMMLAGWPAVASAATPQDVRCFMLSNFFAQKNDRVEGRRLAQMSGFYYLGKLQGMSDAALRRQIAAQQKLIKPATASSEMQGCARGMQASGLHMQSLGPRAKVPPRK
jgi:hypothetical protein